ncbi:MAG: hypothetical protein HDT48_04610 [Ruminococcaceae bacterium]|nr:hypothetical protein [Oscillospiraceae bacterium]
MSDLWPDLERFEDKIPENHAIEILREQARLLSKKTNGKIKATFSKIDYAVSTTEILGGALSAIASGSKKEVVEEEMKGKKDINEFYNFNNYKFEIYDETYKFRIFTLKYRPIYPIQIEIDEGIRKEKLLSSPTDIQSDEELIKIVSSVFSSSKLQMIIKRIMANDTEDT